MQQSGLRALVWDSLMWQKPINHPCSLTGPLQHTLTPAHTQATCMSNHPACGPAPKPHTQRDTPHFPPKTCPMIIPLKHTHACVHTHTLTSVPSNCRLIHLTPSPSILSHFDKRRRLPMSHQTRPPPHFLSAAGEKEHNLGIAAKKIN